MMSFLIWAGGVIVKGLAIGLMVSGCVAIYMVESREIGKEA